MGFLTLQDLVTASSVDDALALELSVATTLGLPTTSWQPLDPSRTILQVNANLVNRESTTVAAIAQGGFASYAAVMPAGTSPYNDGAGFLTTWMDLVGQNVYNVERIEPAGATGPIPVQNITGTAQPYAPGQLHFQHPVSGATYTNTTSGTIALSGSPPTPVVSQVEVTADPNWVGPVGTLSIGQKAIMLTPFPGVSPQAQTVALVGNPIETNAHYLTRCQAKLYSLSPNGASQAYLFVVQSIPTVGSTLPDGTIATAPTPAFPYLVTSPVTRANAFLNIGSGIVDVYVADSAGGLLGSALNPITAITNAIPAVVTVSNPAGIPIGGQSFVIIAGTGTGADNTVAGTTAWVGTYIGANQFSLNNTALPGVYTSGGNAEVGDLGMADAAIQSSTVPTGQQALVIAATNVTVNFAATAYISSKAGISAAQAQTNAQNALTAYLATIPVGGINAESNGIVPGSEMLVVVANANPGTKSVTPTPADVPLTAGQVPVLGTFALTVVFV